MRSKAPDGRRIRAIVVSILGIPLASVIVWLALADRDAFIPSRRAETRTGGTNESVPAIPPAQADAADPASAAVRVPATDTGRTDLGEAATARIVRGRVVVVGRDRVERTEGFGELIVAPKQERPLPPIAVRGGRFDWAAPPGRNFEIRRVTIDGRPTVAETPTLEVAPDTEPVVRVRAIGLTTLRVLDAESGRELHDVSVLNRWKDHPDPDSCSPAEQVVLHRPSPVELRPCVSERGTYAFNCWYLLVAPDHETIRIELDLALGGEFTYCLGASASVEVTLRGWPGTPPDRDRSGTVEESSPLVSPAPVPLVRLRQHPPFDLEARVRDKLAADTSQSPAEASATVLAECGRELVGWRVTCEATPDRSAPVRVDGLKPGSWAVSAELGDENDRRPPLAWTQVELAAGATTPVVLDLPELPGSPEPAPLRGLVEVPESWHSESWSLEIRSAERDRSRRRLTIARDEMAPEAGRPGYFRFAVDAVTPGSYVARVTGFEVQEMFFQTSAGADVEIHVPAPVEAELVLLDRRSRESIDVGTVALSRELSASINEWINTSVEFDATRRVYPLRVPAGSYTIGFGDMRYHEPAGAFEVGVGSTRIECPLEAACGVLVRMLEGDVPRSSRELAHCVGISPKNSGDHHRRYYYEPDRLRIVVAVPGTYEVNVTVPVGFRPIEAREIELHDGEFAPLELHLERK